MTVGKLKRHKTWGWAGLYALGVTTLVLALFYYWFGVANRFIVFLYFHDMGAVVPDTSPFSAVTRSRYGAAGLVAGGLLLLLQTSLNWLLGRFIIGYRPPPWGRVWIIACWPLLAGIPIITMTLNTPTLPLDLALQTSAVTLLSVALALLPGRLAAAAPAELSLLALEGGAMAAVILGLSFLERVRWRVEEGLNWSIGVIGAGLLAALVLLLATTGLRLWRQMAGPKPITLFTAGLVVAYLLLPAIHYLVGTDGYYYITNRDNFFARNWLWQVSAWVAAGGLAWVVTWGRRE